MANWFCPDEGLILLLQRALFASGVSAAEDYYLDLYSNNYTPVYGSTLSNFTLCTFTGYAQATIPAADFAAPTATAPGATTTNSVQGVFSCTSGSSQTAYGCVLHGKTSGKVIAACLFANPRTMSPGATETVTVTLTDLTI